MRLYGCIWRLHSMESTDCTTCAASIGVGDNSTSNVALNNVAERDYAGGDGNDDATLPFPANIVVLGATIGTAIILLGTFGNLLVILSVLTYKPLSRFSNVFVVSLALWDLLQTLCVRPLYIHTYLTGSWQFEQDVCRFALVLSNLSILESIVHVTVIAAFRYVIIVYPMRTARCLLRRRCILAVLVAMYALPLLAVLGMALSADQQIYFNRRIMFCSFVRHRDFRLGGVLKKVLFLALNAALLLFFYVRIVQTVRRSRRDVEAAENARHSSSRIRREMMLLKTVITMFFSFVLTFLPLSIMYGVDTERNFPYVAYFVGVVLLWTSTSINWIIYGCVHSQYAAAYSFILCHKLGGCKSPATMMERHGTATSRQQHYSYNSRTSSVRGHPTGPPPCEQVLNLRNPAGFDGRLPDNIESVTDHLHYPIGPSAYLNMTPHEPLRRPNRIIITSQIVQSNGNTICALSK